MDAANPAIAETADADAPVARRIDIDAARGLAMCLIVFGHALTGIMGYFGETPAGREAILVTYMFHMAVFFVISAALTTGKRRSAGDTARRLLTRIVYPYVLWSMIILLVHHQMSDFTNQRADNLDLLSILYRPPAVMWFLYVLFFIVIALEVTKPLDRRVKAALGVAVFVAAHWVPQTSAEGLLAAQTLRFGGLSLVAAAIGWSALAEFCARPAVMLAGAALLGLAAWMAWPEAQALIPGYPAFRLDYVTGLVGGVALVIGAGVHLSHGAVGKAFAFIGERTMPIFVTHILLTAGARILLTRLGVEDFGVTLLVATLLGIVAPLIAYEIASRLRIAGALGWK